jgi:uncharacterized protein involved in exopolysaccharide biosynthesis
MTAVQEEPDIQVPDSLLEVATLALEHRRALAACVIVCCGISLAIGFMRQPLYRSSASVVVSSAERPDLAQLRGLASQFGFGSIMKGGEELPPEMVNKLLRSPVILLPLLTDSFEVTEVGIRRFPLIDLIRVPPPKNDSRAANAKRQEEGVKRLASLVTASVDSKTGAVGITADTPYPSLSRDLVTRLLDRLDAYIFGLSSARALSERRVLESRLALQEQRLRQAEASLGEFLRQNRLYPNSPSLVFEHDHLQRDVELQQQVLVSISQAREDAFSREVQTAPTLMVVEPPRQATEPQPRHRLLTVLAGALVGVVLGLLFGYTRVVIRNTTHSHRVWAKRFREATHGLSDSDKSDGGAPSDRARA